MTTEPSTSTTPMPYRASVVLIFSLLATWLAAGSLGWISPPLAKALTGLSFAAIIVAALPGHRRIYGGDFFLLAGATLIAFLMNASSLPAVSVLAVAILLAALALVRPGPIAQVCGTAALAAMALAVFRLACEGSAAAWTFTNTAGRLEGLWVGWLTGRRLVIGASFGGIDFLVLMAALSAAWIMIRPRQTIGRILCVALLVLLAQTAYLVALAFSDDLTALLPPIVAPKQDRLSHLGVWTWGNALRTMLPWNLPVLAALCHSAVAIFMFRMTEWHGASRDLHSATDEPKTAVGMRRRNRRLAGSFADSLEQMRPQVNWQRFVPAGLLTLAAIIMTISLVQPDLKNRRIVAYDDGTTDWSTVDPGTVPPGSLPRYGLLPVLVQSLGGTFIRSRELTEEDLRAADVLIVLPPHASAQAAAKPAPVIFPEDVRNKIWRYLADGGRLIVAGDPETALGIEENSLNAVLAPTAISFRDDTANSLTERWEDNLQSAPHAATATSSPGNSYFSFDRAASLRVSWPAGPLIVGHWGWDELGTDPDRPEALPYAPGNHLGDLVLAAQQNVGKGTLVALSAASCLSNDGIPFSYRFTGPLLSALAANASTPLAWWRQMLGLAAAGAAIVLLFSSAHHTSTAAVSVAVASVALALTLWICNLMGNVSGQLSPSGPKRSAQPVIYIDGSHLEGMGRDPWGENGVGRLTRVLADNGYLPLIAPDVSADRLKQAAMLISIAPGKPFTSIEIAAVKQFVSGGGFFLSMAGATDAEPSRTLLDELDLHIKPMPVPPWVREREPTPDGPFFYPSEEQPEVEFYAAWPVTGAPGGVRWPSDIRDPYKKPVLAGNSLGDGQAFLLGDTAFGLKKNFEEFSRNPRFWESSLKNWLGHEPPKPPAGAANSVPLNVGPIPGLPKSSASQGAKP